MFNLELVYPSHLKSDWLESSLQQMYMILAFKQGSVILLFSHLSHPPTYIIIVAGNFQSHIQQSVLNMNAHFSNGSLFYSQTKCIRDILAKTNMSDVKYLLTSMVANFKLLKVRPDYLITQPTIGLLLVP